MLSEWAPCLPLPTSGNHRTSPFTECHLPPINGQRRVTNYFGPSQTQYTNTNETRLSNNVGPVDQSDSDSDKTVPWDSSCDPPPGYTWNPNFLTDQATCGYGETTNMPLVPCFKEETDSE